MRTVRAVPADEIDAELASGWSSDGEPSAGSGAASVSARPSLRIVPVPDRRVPDQQAPDQQAPVQPTPVQPTPVQPVSTRRAVPLEEVVARAAPVALAREHTLPVLTALAGLFPDRQLQRGTTVAVRGMGAASLALAVAAGPSAAGSWVAMVGLPTLGLAASAEVGLVFERLAVIAEPPPSQWAAVVASLVGAFDVVLVAEPVSVRATEARRLASRARERGTVLVIVDLASSGTGSRSGTTRSRSGTGLETDLTLRVVDAAWEGVGEGHGYLRQRTMEVEAGGRRGATRPCRARILFPGPDGQIEAMHVVVPGVAELGGMDDSDHSVPVVHRDVG